MSKNVHDQTPYYHAVDLASFFVSGFCLNFSLPETVHQLELMNCTFFLTMGMELMGRRGLHLLQLAFTLWAEVGSKNETQLFLRCGLEQRFQVQKLKYIVI